MDPLGRPRGKPAMTLSVWLCLAAGCSGDAGGKNGGGPGVAMDRSKSGNPEATEVATLGGGCFWCLDAVFQGFPGVRQVASGYMGGKVPRPTYEQVCTGRTGHAEVVQVRFDPKQLSYEKLLDLFWKLHDPTTLNRQGDDVGTQYRSVIFHHSEAQRQAAERSREALAASGAWPGPIVTEIARAGEFYPADDHHQDYYRRNRSQPYCRVVIAPKLDKLGLKR